MKAIRTRYTGPTDTKGARIIATDGDRNRKVVGYDHSLSSEEMHRAAAEALRDKMGWTGNLIQGGLGNDYVFVFAPDDYEEALEALAAVNRVRAAAKGATK